MDRFRLLYLEWIEHVDNFNFIEKSCYSWSFTCTNWDSFYSTYGIESSSLFEKYESSHNFLCKLNETRAQLMVHMLHFVHLTSLDENDSIELVHKMIPLIEYIAFQFEFIENGRFKLYMNEVLNPMFQDTLPHVLYKFYEVMELKDVVPLSLINCLRSFINDNPHISWISKEDLFKEDEEEEHELLIPSKQEPKRSDPSHIASLLIKMVEKEELKKDHWKQLKMKKEERNTDILKSVDIMNNTQENIKKRTLQENKNVTSEEKHFSNNKSLKENKQGKDWAKKMMFPSTEDIMKKKTNSIDHSSRFLTKSFNQKLLAKIRKRGRDQVKDDKRNTDMVKKIKRS